MYTAKQRGALRPKLIILQWLLPLFVRGISLPDIFRVLATRLGGSGLTKQARVKF